MISPSASQVASLAPEPGGRWLAFVTTGLPLWVALAFILAVVSGRLLPVAMSVAMGPLLAVLLALGLRQLRIRVDQGTWLLVLLVVAYVAWMSLAVAWGTPRSAAWWRLPERAAALVALLAVLASGVSGAVLLRWLGASSACVLLIALAADGWYQWGTGSFATFGFGHWNYLLNPHGAPLLGWTAVLWASQRRGESQRVTEWGLLVAGWSALAVLVLVTHRRGVPLALACGLLAAGWAWWVGRQPRLAWVVAIVGAVAAVVAVAWLYRSSLGTYGQERLLQYWASAATAWHHLPFGSGPYAEADILTDPSEPARWMTATGGYALHAHNEPLDVLLGGGLPGLALFLGLALGILQRLSRIADRSERRAWTLVLGALAVHLMTDPTFGQDLGQWWLLVLVGCLYRCETTTPGRIRTLALSWWTLGLLPIVSFGTAAALVPALAGFGLPLNRQLAYADLTLHPQWCTKLIEQAFQSPALSPVQRAQALELFANRMGPHLDVIGHRAIYLPPADPGEAVEAVLALLRPLPFERRGYERLDALLRAHPDLRDRVPATVLERMRRLTGDPSLPPVVEPVMPGSLDEVIDRWAEAVWCLDRGRDNPTGWRILRLLGDRYVSVPAIAELAFLASLDDPSHFTWLVRHRGRVLEQFGRMFPRATSYVVTPEHAHVVLDWLALFFAEDIVAVRAGHRPPSLPDWSPLTPYVQELLRLNGLERRWLAGQVTPGG